MQLDLSRVSAVVATFALALALSACGKKEEPVTYRFELAGQVQKTSPGVNVVPIRLIKMPGNEPVKGAVIFETRADMGPENMAGMTAPVKVLPESQPGIYPIEVTFGDIWNRPGSWALTLAAKVQGETETARGSVTVKLEP